LKTFDGSRIDGLSGWFESASAAAIAQLIADGIRREAISITGSIDCRYIGQGFELNVPIDSWDTAGLADIPARFHELHETLYGHANRQEDLELVTVRVAVLGAFNRTRGASTLAEGGVSSEDAVVSRRDVFIPGSGKRAETPVYERELLKIGNRITGPAIIQQMDATTVIMSGQTATVTHNGDLLLRED